LLDYLGSIDALVIRRDALEATLSTWIHRVRTPVPSEPDV
jgi:hypothetical protein